MKLVTIILDETRMDVQARRSLPDELAVYVHSKRKSQSFVSVLQVSVPLMNIL